jgi:hypothetical protein
MAQITIAAIPFRSMMMIRSSFAALIDCRDLNGCVENTFGKAFLLALKPLEKHMIGNKA